MKLLSDPKNISDSLKLLQIDINKTTPQIDVELLKKAWRMAMKEYHPDGNIHSNAKNISADQLKELESFYTRHAQYINKAHEMLKKDLKATNMYIENLKLDKFRDSMDPYKSLYNKLSPKMNFPDFCKGVIKCKENNLDLEQLIELYDNSDLTPKISYGFQTNSNQVVFEKYLDYVITSEQCGLDFESLFIAYTENKLDTPLPTYLNLSTMCQMRSQSIEELTLQYSRYKIMHYNSIQNEGTTERKLKVNGIIPVDFEDFALITLGTKLNNMEIVELISGFGTYLEKKNIKNISSFFKYTVISIGFVEFCSYHSKMLSVGLNLSNEMDKYAKSDRLSDVFIEYGNFSSYCDWLLQERSPQNQQEINKEGIKKR